MLTVKQIADQLGVSKSTARRYLQKIQAVPSESVHESVHGTVSKQKEYRYPESVLDDIYTIIGDNIKKKQTTDEKNESVHKPVHGAVNEPAYEALLKQLQVKDQQIESLQKALDQAQQLQAIAESRVKLLEDQTEKETSAPAEKKIHWWNRIFS